MTGPTNGTGTVLTNTGDINLASGSDASAVSDACEELLPCTACFEADTAVCAAAAATDEAPGTNACCGNALDCCEDCPTCPGAVAEASTGAERARAAAVAVGCCEAMDVDAGGQGACVVQHPGC